MSSTRDRPLATAQALPARFIGGVEVVALVVVAAVLALVLAVGATARHPRPGRYRADQALPSVSGIEAGEAWPGQPYGLAVTAKDASTVLWMVTGASNTALAAVDGERLAEQPMPDLPGGKAAVAQIEQALLTALAAGSEKGDIVRAERYSTRPTQPAVGYGATVDFTDGWRLFLAAVGTARRGENLSEHRHYKPDATV